MAFFFVEWFNADSFIAFLKQLVRYYDGTKVHLITDNVPYHKAQRCVSGCKEKRT